MPVDKYTKMIQIYGLCKELGLKIPKDVKDYFQAPFIEEEEFFKESDMVWVSDGG